MEYLASLPVFGIILTIICYSIGNWARKKTGFSLANPMIIANILILLILCLTPLTLEQYMAGGGVIAMFIVPVTTILALRIYRQRALLKANVLPIVFGCLAGSLASVLSILAMCRLLDIDDVVIHSLLPKSVTTAIAMELSVNNGGLGGLTVSAVIVTGIISAVLAPFFIKTFKLKDPVAAGIAMGASGHAISTATALELGEIQGAAAGIAITLMGIITSIILFF